MSNALSKPQIRSIPVGDSAWLFEFGASIDRETNRQVRGWAQQIMTHAPEGLVECVPAFASLSVVFDPLQVDHDTFLDALKALPDPEVTGATAARRWRLPVCYDPTMALDLEAAAAELELSPAALVEAHSSTVLFAYALGFMPGFAYMGGLPDALALPRLKVPRNKVPASSVAVTGTMSGIYPFASPGGWRILGRTPLTMFDPARSPASIIEAGDEVQFQPISLNEYEALVRRPPPVETLR